MHTAWSKNVRYFTGEEIIDKFIEIVLSIEEERDICPEPKVNFPFRGERTQLVTRSKYLDLLDNNGCDEDRSRYGA